MIFLGPAFLLPGRLPDHRLQLLEFPRGDQAVFAFDMSFGQQLSDLVGADIVHAAQILPGIHIFSRWGKK